jgi:hypothetical protein
VECSVTGWVRNGIGGEVYSSQPFSSFEIFGREIDGNSLL